MTTIKTEPLAPSGTWQLDPVHSTIAFQIPYLVGTFKGSFRRVEATLGVSEEGATLTGSADVESVDVKDENLAAHLQSPEFFDVERHPQLHFRSTSVERSGDDLHVGGEITIKGVTKPIELRGRIGQPLTDAFGRERLGIELGTRLDRTDFGLNWNLPLPTGKPALGDEVELQAELYFVRG